MAEENEVMQLQRAIEILNEYRKTLTTSVSEMGNTVTALDSRIRKIESNGNMKQEVDVLNERINNLSQVSAQKLEATEKWIKDVSEKINANEQKDIENLELLSKQAKLLEEQAERVSEAIAFKEAVRNFVKELVK